MSIGVQSVTVLAGWPWRQHTHPSLMRSLFEALHVESLTVVPQNVLLKICQKLTKTA
jgi:hypothetical protein